MADAPSAVGTVTRSSKRQSAFEGERVVWTPMFAFWGLQLAPIDCLYLPHTAFYLETGQPYPWAVTHNTEFMPYARD